MKDILVGIVEIILLIMVIPLCIGVVLGIETLLIWGVFSGVIYLFGLTFAWGLWKSFILACIISLISFFYKLFIKQY